MNVLNFFRNPQVSNSHQFEARTLDVRPDGDITYPKGGWEPAGYDIAGSYVVLSRKTGQLMTLRAQDFEEKKLVLMLGPKILEDHQTFNPVTQVLEFSK